MLFTSQYDIYLDIVYAMRNSIPTPGKRTPVSTLATLQVPETADMKFPQDAHLMYVVFKLMDCGLTADKIDRAMKKMVGADWTEVNVSTWRKRLQADGSFIEDDDEVFVDDLAALIHGRTKLDDIHYF